MTTTKQKNAPDKKKTDPKGPERAEIAHPEEEAITGTGSDDNEPGKSILIDDNPEETKRKIPNMRR